VNGYAPTMDVLVVEDDDGIARPLVAGLEREGHAVTRVATAAAALAEPEHDLVLLDLRLPDGDGIDVCRTIRGRSAVPIIILSARDTEADRVVGLEMGADDYLVKPFGMAELMARIRAVVRRTEVAGDAAVPETLAWGPLSVDRATRSVRIDDARIDLTQTEFDVLAEIVAAGGAVVSRRDLLRSIWDSTWYGPSKAIDMHIANIRRKLGDATLIETVRGVGYRMAERFAP